MTDFSTFAKTIFEQKYAHDIDKRKETWPELAQRVSSHVMRAVKAPDYLTEAIRGNIERREFIPGGRYLYATGRQFHQVQNCLLMKANDSREGWAEIQYKATLALMTGAGIGIVYSGVRGERKLIKKTGGKSTGPLALMQMVNESGRYIMQGGSRRSAIWAGLQWDHPDVFKFIHIKDWTKEVRALKAKDYNFPATLDGTNISVTLNDEFFEAYRDDDHDKHNLAHMVYWDVIRQMLKTGEPGFSVDLGDNAGEELRNAPISAKTNVLTSNGYVKVGDIVDKEVNIWTGHQWASTTFRKTGHNVPVVKVTLTGGREIICDPTHEFIEENESRTQAQSLIEGVSLKTSFPYSSVTRSEAALHSDAYLLGFIVGDGSYIPGYNRAELTLCTNEKKACLTYFDSSLIRTVTEKDKRGYTRLYTEANFIFSDQNKEHLPKLIYSFPKEKQAAFIAGLFDSDGSYQETNGRLRFSSQHKTIVEEVRRLLESFGILAGVNKAGVSTFGNKLGYNLTVQTDFVSKFGRIFPTNRLKIKPIKAYRKSKLKVISIEPAGNEDVFCCDVGVSEHSFQAEGVIISNCTEVTSRDPDDICNLGSINMANIIDFDHMRSVVKNATAFLLAGTVYSDVPYPNVDQVRSKNRRLGLGLMGIHEWLLKKGKRYAPDAELEEYYKIYAKSTEIAADYAEQWDLSKPKKTRAIAPTGTIGIVAETTTGIEPIYCVAYKRRYLKGNVYHYQYVIDPTAKRLIENGVKPHTIEDAYSLSEDVRRRVAFQAWTQKYVDHAISSTINLPPWGSPNNNENMVTSFGDMLMEYLPELRGITCYPDGSRDGQPLTAVSYEEAVGGEGEVFIETGDVCSIRGGGSCGA